MPELPEVQALTERLAEKLPGRRIAAVKIRRPRLVAPDKAQAVARRLRGAVVQAVSRRAKSIRIDLDRDRVLLAHMRMTGHLFVKSAAPARRESASERSISAILALDDGSALIFDDSRALGTLRLLSYREADAKLAELGIEPLSNQFTPSMLFALSRGRSSPLKLFLLDQRRIAGLGNIYAAEALWRARLDPRRPAGAMSRAEATRLHRAILQVLEEAIAAARAAYRRAGAAGDEADFQAAVYQRAGEKCTRCGCRIQRLRQGGRSTFFCPGCQR